MGQIDWDELPIHCLVEILGRVGMESLVENVPLVCKSWYDATFYPQCWQQLVFTKSHCIQRSNHSIPGLLFDKDSWFDSDLVVPIDCINNVDDSLDKLLQFAIGRSKGLVTEVVFHPESHLKEGQIAWIARRCPSLKLLVLPSHLSYVINFEVSDSIYNWKDLEAIQLASDIGLMKTIVNISKHCLKFNHLSVHVPRLNGDVALAIASQLPHIKTLDLRFSIIERDDLVVILKGCKKLEHLNVSKYKSIVDDSEILKLTRHIRVFIHGDSFVTK